MQNAFWHSVFKQFFFEKKHQCHARETPSPFIANAIKNFHFVFKYFPYENVASLQAMFNFLEKFGFRDGRPGPVPKMLQEEVAPPGWAREHLQAAKKAEQDSKDSSDNQKAEGATDGRPDSDMYWIKKTFIV